MDPQSPAGAPPPSGAPSSSLPQSAPAGEGATVAPVGGWAVDAGHGVRWWTEGWRLFAAAPLVWIAMTFVLVALLFVLALVPILGHIASTVLYPVLAAGLLVGARALDRGEPLMFSHLFACFDQRVGPLIVAALLYLLGWFVVWLVAILICAAIFGFGSLAALLSTDAAHVDLTALATLGVAALVALMVVLVLGTPLMMAYWFAPALVALRGDRPVTAMKASFAASLRNLPPLLVYGLLGIVFGLLATLPLALGWIVLAPVFAASVYVSYRDIFGA